MHRTATYRCDHFQYSICSGSSYGNKIKEKPSAKVNIADTCVVCSFKYTIEIDVCLLQMQVCPRVIHLVVYVFVNINNGG